MIHDTNCTGKDVPIQSDDGQTHVVQCNGGDYKNQTSSTKATIYSQTTFVPRQFSPNTIRCPDLAHRNNLHNLESLPPIPTKMNIGESQNLQKKQMLLCAFREKKSQRKPVLQMSTSEAAGMTQMGGFNISDRKIYHVSAERPSKRYWKKIFFNLLDMTLLNAYELYRLYVDAVDLYDKMCRIDRSRCTYKWYIRIDRKFEPKLITP